MKSIFVLSLSLAMMTSGAVATAAEENSGSPGYIESIETEATAGGIAQEVDATDAQVEELEADGSVQGGVSRKRAQQLEEIVVSARRRDELLEVLLEQVPASSRAIRRRPRRTRERARGTPRGGARRQVPPLR